MNAPSVSPNTTWEGFVGGVATAILIGTALWWATPFAPWQAAVMSLAVTLMGFAGGLTMSAIKRDRGVKDFGALIPGNAALILGLGALYMHFLRRRMISCSSGSSRPL